MLLSRAPRGNWSDGSKNLETVILKIRKRDFPGGAVVKNPPANAGDMGLSPGP